MATNTKTIALCDYPGALKAALYGFSEMLDLLAMLSQQAGVEASLDSVIVKDFDLACSQQQTYDVVFIPPSIGVGYYFDPEPNLIDWINQQHKAGAVITSACAGAFILAKTQVIGGRSVTTHWGLAHLLKEQFPNINLDANKLLIDHGDLITAGGMMAWLDLGLELVAKYVSVAMMRKLGKALVVDTAPREQSYYQEFNPNYQHSDQEVVQIQRDINENLGDSVNIQQLAAAHHMTTRTLQRRFTKATGYTPLKYIQKLKVQKACEQLENTAEAFDSISRHLGYENVTAFRKVFIKLMGLTPSEFKSRFARR